MSVKKAIILVSCAVVLIGAIYFGTWAGTHPSWHSDADQLVTAIVVVLTVAFGIYAIEKE